MALGRSGSRETRNTVHAYEEDVGDGTGARTSQFEASGYVPPNEPAQPMLPETPVGGLDGILPSSLPSLFNSQSSVGIIGGT